MTARRLACIIAAAGLASLARADAPDDVTALAVYESIDDIAIGRVFLSPAERQQLDAIRHLPERGASASSDAAATPTPGHTKPRGVGFIRAQGKAARVFKDGDFVAVTPGERAFAATPEGVIVRHEDNAVDDVQ